MNFPRRNFPIFFIKLPLKHEDYRKVRSEIALAPGGLLKFVKKIVILFSEKRQGAMSNLHPPGAHVGFFSETYEKYGVFEDANKRWIDDRLHKRQQTYLQAPTRFPDRVTESPIHTVRSSFRGALSIVQGPIYFTYRKKDWPGHKVVSEGSSDINSPILNLRNGHRCPIWIS